MKFQDSHKSRQRLRSRSVDHLVFDEHHQYKKGERVGEFRVGSTIVLVSYSILYNLNDPSERPSFVDCPFKRDRKVMSTQPHKILVSVQIIQRIFKYPIGYSN